MNPEPPLSPTWNNLSEAAQILPILNWLHQSLEITEACPLRKARLAGARGALQDLTVELSSQESWAALLTSPSSLGPEAQTVDLLLPTAVFLCKVGRPLRARLHQPPSLLLCTSILLLTVVDGNMEGRKRGKKG